SRRRSIHACAGTVRLEDRNGGIHIDADQISLNCRFRLQPAAFEHHFSFEICPVAPDSREGRNCFTGLESHTGVFSFKVAGNRDSIAGTAMANISNSQAIMITPKERDRLKTFVFAENISRRGLTLPLGYDPVF